MKSFVLDFLRRGVCAMGFGPIVLAVLYFILQSAGVVDTLSGTEVGIGILSLSLLALFAGGLNALYQIERLPLMLAVFIHGAVLYVCYLATYLVNSWLAWDITHLVVFSAIFVVGYVVIWIVVCSVIKRNTKRLNQALRAKQRNI